MHCPDAVYGPEYTETTTLTWEGCVGSRNGLHRTYPEYGSQRIPGINAWSCNTPLTPLTNDYTEVRNGINNMNANNETHIPAGLIWGWRTLDPQVPFNEASLLSGDRIRALVLMSDGANTKSKGATGRTRSRPEADAYHEVQDGVASDAFTAELCTNIKADDIRLFVIAYKLDSLEAADTHATLRACASNSGDFYDTDTAAGLNAAFEAISNSFSDTVRLSR